MERFRMVSLLLSSTDASKLRIERTTTGRVGVPKQTERYFWRKRERNQLDQARRDQYGGAGLYAADLSKMFIYHFSQPRVEQRRIKLQT
jgi:hypothetical protein